MNPTLDIVIPVKFPSIHLTPMRKNLDNLPRNVQVKYILDCDCDSNLDTVIRNMNLKPREQVIGGNYGSPGQARNSGLDKCKSKYVIFWDVDDEPNLIQTLNLMNYIDLESGDIGIGNWFFREFPGKLQGISPLSVGTAPGIWRFLFRREFLQDLRFSNLKWGEDQLFILKVLSKNPKIITSNTAIYGYTKHVQGALTTDTRNVIDLIEANRKGLEYLWTIKGSARVCAEIMHFRQILTVLKHRKPKAAWKLMLSSLTNIQLRHRHSLEIFLQWKRLTRW